jgi:tryptophan synthase alpha chain
MVDVTVSLVSPLHDFRRMGRCARIIGYLPGLYPHRDAYRRALDIVAAAGIRAIEIGIPGAVGSLEGGIISEALEKVRLQVSSSAEVIETAARDVTEAGLVPIVMAFRDTVFGDTGVDEFVERVLRGGASLALVPDVDAGQYRQLTGWGTPRGVQFVRFVPATDGTESDDEVLHFTDTPLVYIQTADMPTGGSFVPSDSLRRRVHRYTTEYPDVPVGVGFGIRTGEDVTRVHRLGADFAIIGTPMVEALNGGTESLQKYLRTLTGGQEGCNEF